MQNLIDLKTQMAGKQLVGYGAGFAAVATLQSTDLKFSALVDDNLELQGQTIFGIPIRARSYLNELDPKSSFIVVFAYTGMFSNTLPHVYGEDFAIVYVDCDLYAPTLECCEFFYQRVKPGGIFLFHDYCRPEPDLPNGISIPFTGVKKAVDEFFNGSPEEVIEFPETTHALVIKK